MKTTILILCLAFALHSQTNSTSSNPTKYLVEYTSLEKCNDCNYLTAVVCLNGADCNVPVQDIRHFQEFPTIKEAIAFVNGGMITGPETWNVSQEIHPRTFVRLLSFSVVSVSKDERVRREPQPDKEIRAVEYHVGNEYGHVSYIGIAPLVGTLDGVVGKSPSSIAVFRGCDPGEVLVSNPDGTPRCSAVTKAKSKK